MMSALIYGIRLQFRMDIRSRTLLVTCYLVPLLFFAVMGGIFTSLMPEAKDTLIASMTVMGVSMGALIGVSAPLFLEIYGTDIRKMYRVGEAPQFFGLISLVISAFVHLMIMSGLILAIAPAAFDAKLPKDIGLYFAKLSLFLIVSLALSCVLGLAVKNQAKLTMLSQVFFFAVDPAVRDHCFRPGFFPLPWNGQESFSRLPGDTVCLREWKTAGNHSWRFWHCCWYPCWPVGS